MLGKDSKTGLLLLPGLPGGALRSGGGVHTPTALPAAPGLMDKGAHVGAGGPGRQVCGTVPPTPCWTTPGAGASPESFL